MSSILKLTRFIKNPNFKLVRFNSTVVKKESIFFDSEVQTLLRQLTGLDYDRVFRTKKMGTSPHRPIYQFMTEEELQEAHKEARMKAEQKLQMPPVMDERSSSTRVLEEDPELAGLDTCNYVFTDITDGVSARSRIIVVREPDGTLRTCNWDEQDRLNQIYFPIEGRKHYVPQMFEDEHLQSLLKPDKYEYILERNCLQFEPDHPHYIRTCDKVFSHISEHKHFDSLYSTRHYGPMVFNLCWNKNLDELLAHLIWSDRLQEAETAIKVYLIIHPECKLSTMEVTNLSSEELVRSFAKYESLKPGKINMALDKLLEVKQATAKLQS